MDERDRRRIGEQIEPGGRPKAPGRLDLLQRFINTHNHDLPTDWDRLGTWQKAQAWLREKRLITSRERVTDADALRLRKFRETLRALVVSNQGVEPGPLRFGVALLRVEVDDEGHTSLVSDARGVEGVEATLLGIVHEAQLIDEWPRLKGCRQCGYAFFDRSKNRSAAWCAMSICGNRTKNRAYYKRRRSAEP
jgi:predicted RNA-binding Zn ribbon-like protein